MQTKQYQQRDIHAGKTVGRTGTNSKSNSLTVEMVAITELTFPYRPLRKGREERIQKHVISLQAHDHVIPITTDNNLGVLVGDERVEAADRLGQTHVPVIRVLHLTKANKRSFRLIEAKVANMGEFDFGNIKLEFEDLLSFDPEFDFDLTGFDIPEQEMIFDFGSSDANQEFDPADSTNITPGDVAITQVGDIWTAGKHRIICGDVQKKATLKKLLNGKKAKCVNSDLPYNVPMNGHAGGLGKKIPREFVMASGEMSRQQFKCFLNKSIKRLKSCCEDGALLYLFMDWRSIELLLNVCRKLDLKLINICVWKKTNAGMGSFYRSQHELIVVVRNGNTQHRNNIQLGKFGRSRSNCWTYPSVNTFGKERMALLNFHPTVKTVALIADAIKDCTKRGDIVVDGFMGSGTILIAAEKTNRKAYCAELDPLYVDVAVRRYQQRFGVDVIHEKTGLTFDQLAVERTVEHEPAKPHGRIRTRRNRPTKKEA